MLKKGVLSFAVEFYCFIPRVNTTEMVSSTEKVTPYVSKISLALHLIGFIWYLCGVYYGSTLKLPACEFYGGKFQYITHITTYIVFFSTGLATVIDAVQTGTGALENHSASKTEISFILILRNDLVSFWSYTLATFVCLMYWGIAAVDLDGIHPVEIRSMLPINGYFNHFIHSVPIFYVNILIVLVNYELPGKKKATFYSAILVITYVSWLLYCDRVNQRSAYKFMEKFSVAQFCMFVGFSILVFFGIYLLGKKFKDIIWTDNQKDKYT